MHRVYSVVTLVAVAAAGAVLVTSVERFAEPRIPAAREQILIRKLGALIGAASTGGSRIERLAPPLRRLSVQAQARPLVYAVYRHGALAGHIVVSQAPRAYNGPITFAVGLDLAGTITKVRILEHSESPGFGDQIHQDHSDWLEAFVGRSLGKEAAQTWQLRRDGGQFDAWAGATITSAAMINALYETLVFYRNWSPSAAAR